MTQRHSWHTGCLAIIAMLVALLAILAWWLYQPVAPRRDGPGGNSASGDPPAGDSLPLPAFQTAVEAVAATEEADFRRASRLWAQLIKILPEDPDLQLNQAVASLKWIDTLTKQFSSGQVTPEEEPALRKELEEAFAQAEPVVQQLAAIDTSDFRVPLVQAALLEIKANQLQYPADIELRKQAANILLAALKKNPSQPLLARSFDDLVTMVGDDDSGLAADRMEYLYASWKAQPRNLFLLRRSADTLLQGKDPRLTELLQPSLDYTRPLVSMVQADVDKVKPDEMLAEVAEAIAAGDWRGARKIVRWLNIIRGMPGFHEDFKQVKPDPLALLDTTFLARLAPKLTTASEPSAPLPTYASHELSSHAGDVLWYDVDFDQNFDVVAVNGSQLEFLKLSAATALESATTLELPFEPIGILAADLFEVGSPDRPNIPSSVEALMLEDAASPSPPTQDEAEASNQHDTIQELVVWGKPGIRIVSYEVPEGAQNGRFFVLDEPTGLEGITDVVQIERADIESDGDLDLLVVTTGGMLILRNNGNRTFNDISTYSYFPEVPTPISKVVACDFDRDMDQDFMLLTEDGAVSVLENILHGQFRLRALDAPQWQAAGGAVDLTFADLDGNASWDWLTVGAEDIRVTLTRCTGPGELTPMRSTSTPDGGSEIKTGDLNNDGYLDLMVGGPAGLAIRLGSASGRFAQPQTIGTGGTAVSALSTIDQNGDGSLEILAIVDGKPTVWSAESAPEGHFVGARIVGINDSNGGGRVNHYAIGSTLEIWAGGKHFSRAVTSPLSHFGLGSLEPDNLRIIFPHGLTQNYEEVKADMLIVEKQIPRGSCPFLYGWNGERFELITDLLWNAPLGLQIARGQVLPDRRWENLFLPGRLVQIRDGAYELRVTEELWEVAYFDHITLTAVDHPADVDVFTNEKVGPAAIAQHQLFTAGERVHPQSATDSYNRDLRSKLSRQDQVYAHAFQRQICQGLCEPHFIELDFGKLPTEQPLRLFLTGWLYPTDTSLNIGIAQNPNRSAPEPPSLWGVDEDGRWVCANPFIGFPGGKPKSIVIDLEGVFRGDDHRLRIGSSQQIYWDEAFVSWDSDTSQIRQTEVALQSAQLNYRGFSAMLPREPDQPHWYDYQSVTSDPKWPPLEGPFTRFGDVRELLSGDDDRMVVITAGDEIVLRFEVPEQPLPEGWQRDFVLHSTGWDKDADINTLSGQGSLPLPFMDQTAYPASLEQADQAADVWEKNAPTLGRLRQTVPRESLN